MARDRGRPSHAGRLPGGYAARPPTTPASNRQLGTRAKHSPPGTKRTDPPLAEPGRRKEDPRLKIAIIDAGIAFSTANRPLQSFASTPGSAHRRLGRVP